LAEYIARRLLHGVLVMLGISLFVFAMLRLTGDPAILMFNGAGRPTAAALAQIRHALGIDRPFWVQYGSYIWGALHGNLGTSFTTRQPVALMLSQAFPNTLILAIAAMLIAIVISVPLGVSAAVRRGRSIDLISRIASLLGVSFPNFWLGIMLIVIFGAKLRWFPIGGFDSWGALVLPALTLGLILCSVLTRLIRSAMLSALTQQYVVTARAKGLAERLVIARHALRNALIPTVTFLGLQFGGLLGGTVIIEQVFGWPGVGQLALQAINSRDYPTVEASVIGLAAVMVLVNFLVDITYGMLDPRIHWGR
jgi:peptide/nickel transport system permease protein